MFAIKDLENNIIDLENLKEYDNSFEVLCLNEKGKRLPFYIDFISSRYISVGTFNVSSIRISINVEYITKEEYIVLRDINGVRLKIIIKPNSYFVNDRIYNFKITKSEVNDNTMKIRILSKVNKSEIGWKCIQDGPPLNYTITPRENNKSGYVNIKLDSHVLTDYNTTIRFMQDESGEILELRIKNTPNGMEIIEKAS
jgi:hypothetical protein